MMPGLQSAGGLAAKAVGARVCCCCITICILPAPLTLLLTRSLCECPLLPQVTRLHSFAFPLAEVAVAVMASQPDMVPLLAARLHQVGWRSGAGSSSGGWEAPVVCLPQAAPPLGCRSVSPLPAVDSTTCHPPLVP